MRGFRRLLAVALLSGTGLAGAQTIDISIPGVASAKGSMGSTVTNSQLTSANNKASDITVGGGSAGINVKATTVSLNMAGVANVNGINVTGSRVTDSHVSVTTNTADTVTAIGGVGNVNNVNIN